MKVYKVVRSINGVLKSCYADPAISVTYKPGKIARPRIKNSLLSAFRTLAHARRFVGYDSHIQIWIADAEISRLKPRFVSKFANFTGDHTRRWPVKSTQRVLRAIWNINLKQFYDYNERADLLGGYFHQMSTPKGTVMCKTITILRHQL